MIEFPFTTDLDSISELTRRVAYEDFPGTQESQVSNILNTAFWASMETEEGRYVRTSLAFLTRDHLRFPRATFPATQFLSLSNPIELSPHNIAKLSASFSFRPGATVVTLEEHPRICGLILPKPTGQWLLDILGPGYIVIRRGHSVQAGLLPGGSGFLVERDAVLEDDWRQLLVDHTGIRLQVPDDLPYLFCGCLAALARAMIDHRRGGSVVLVSPDDDSWKSGIDFSYKFERENYLSSLLAAYIEFTREAAKAREGTYLANAESDSEVRQQLLQTLRLVGGMTAVDGALVLTTDFNILGYGAKLKPEPRTMNVKEWFPFRRDPWELKSLDQIGGTRHRSAAQFAAQYPKTTVFVASQDGRFTVFCCDRDHKDVLALRAEVLLL